MGTFLVDVFEQYNWRRVVFISSNFFVWQEAAKAIVQVCGDRVMSSVMVRDSRLPCLAHPTSIVSCSLTIGPQSVSRLISPV